MLENSSRAVTFHQFHHARLESHRHPRSSDGKGSASVKGLRKLQEGLEKLGGRVEKLHEGLGKLGDRLEKGLEKLGERLDDRVTLQTATILTGFQAAIEALKGNTPSTAAATAAAAAALPPATATPYGAAVALGPAAAAPTPTLTTAAITLTPAAVSQDQHEDAPFATAAALQADEAAPAPATAGPTPTATLAADSAAAAAPAPMVPVGDAPAANPEGLTGAAAAATIPRKCTEDAGDAMGRPSKRTKH